MISLGIVQISLFLVVYMLPESTGFVLLPGRIHSFLAIKEYDVNIGQLRPISRSWRTFTECFAKKKRSSKRKKGSSKLYEDFKPPKKAAKQIDLLRPPRSYARNTVYSTFGGYNYSDGVKKHDVPFLDEPMWFDLFVVPASTLELANYFQSLMNTSKWNCTITDVYCPLNIPYYRFGAQKKLMLLNAPLVPGFMYIKCRMNPRIADNLEDISGVIDLRRNVYGLVLPVEPDRVERMLQLRVNDSKAIAAASQLIEQPKNGRPFQRGSYIKVVAPGKNCGKYGIFASTERGQLRVDMISADGYQTREVIPSLEDMEVVENIPGYIPVKNMSTKELVVSLMKKKPDSMVLTALYDAGVLNNILNDENYSKKTK